MITIQTVDDAIQGKGDGRFEISASIVYATDVVISYLVTGTATQFTPLSGNVTLPKGQTRAYIDVIPTQYENNKTVSIVLLNGSGYTVAKPSVATVTMKNTVQIKRDAFCRAKKLINKTLAAACDRVNGYLCASGATLPLVINGQPVYATQQAADEAIKTAAALNPSQVINPGVVHQIRDVVVALTHWKLGMKPGFRNKAMEQDYTDAKEWLKDIAAGRICVIVKNQKQSSSIAVGPLNNVFTDSVFDESCCCDNRNRRRAW